MKVNNSKLKTAMIFAAGFGTRMRPLTDATPKPLVKVNNKALIDYSLELLEKWEIENVVINTHYLHDQIVEHIKNYHGNLNIQIIFEDPVLETGGGVVNAMSLLGNEPFLTINSDIILIDKYSDIMSKLCEGWNPEGSDALMLLQDTAHAIGYDGNGDFNINSNGNVVKTDNKKHDYVFTGCMILKPEIFQNIKVEPFSIYRDFLKGQYMDQSGVHNKIKGVINTGDWYHVGTPENIAQAEDKLNRS